MSEHYDQREELHGSAKRGLIQEPGYSNSFDTAIKCFSEEILRCERNGLIARASMLRSVIDELRKSTGAQKERA